MSEDYDFEDFFNMGRERIDDVIKNALEPKVFTPKDLDNEYSLSTPYFNEQGVIEEGFVSLDPLVDSSLDSLIADDVSSLFKSYLSDGKFAKAIVLYQNNSIDFEKNKYVHSFEEFVLLAAYDLQSLGDHSSAFKVVNHYLPGKEYTVEFAKNFIVDRLADIALLYDANSNSPEVSASLNKKIDAYTEEVFFVIRDYFPESSDFVLDNGQSLMEYLRLNQFETAARLYRLEKDFLSGQMEGLVDDNKFEEASVIKKEINNLNSSYFDN